MQLGAINGGQQRRNAEERQRQRCHDDSGLLLGRVTQDQGYGRAGSHGEDRGHRSNAQQTAYQTGDIPAVLGELAGGYVVRSEINNGSEERDKGKCERVYAKAMLAEIPRKDGARRNPYA